MDILPKSVSYFTLSDDPLASRLTQRRSYDAHTLDSRGPCTERLVQCDTSASLVLITVDLPGHPEFCSASGHKDVRFKKERTLRHSLPKCNPTKEKRAVLSPAIAVDGIQTFLTQS